MNFKKTDVLILGKMETAGAINAFKRSTIGKIIESTKLSATKVRASIKLLLEEEYIQEGFMSHNAKSYFVTEKGREFLKELGCPINSLE